MYDFDEIVDRQNTNALNTDGFRGYIFGVEDSEDGMKFPYKDDEFIRMWVADMEFATPDVVLNGIKDRLNRRILGYTRVFSDDYYNSFVNWCERRYQWTFKKEELLTSNGIIPALYELVDYITQPDEKVLFLTPSYVYFKTAADFNGREAVCSDLINENGYYSIDFKDLEKKAKEDKTTLLIFCNPHNPTGRVWKEDELQEVARIVKENNLWVISDEIWSDLLRKNKKHIPLGKVLSDYEKLVTAMAPSKTFNTAGLMFSNIIIRSEKLREIWNERHYSFDNPLSIAGAQAAYDKGEKWLNELQDYLDDNFDFTKEYLNKHLPKSSFKISEATYLAWVNLEEYFDKNVNLPDFFAQNAGVLLEGGNMFVQNSDSFIRLNLAMPRVILEEGLKRICTAVNKKDN